MSINKETAKLDAALVGSPRKVGAALKTGPTHTPMLFLGCSCVALRGVSSSSNKWDFTSRSSASLQRHSLPSYLSVFTKPRGTDSVLKTVCAHVGATSSQTAV